MQKVLSKRQGEVPAEKAFHPSLELQPSLPYDKRSSQFLTYGFATEGLSSIHRATTLPFVSERGH
jgi:hypothetical protein